MRNGKKLINEVKILKLYTGIILTRSGQVYQNKNSSELFCSALKYLKGHKIRNENITCLGKAALWIISLHSRSSSGKIFQSYLGIISTFFTSPWAPRIILSEQCGCGGKGLLHNATLVWSVKLTPSSMLRLIMNSIHFHFHYVRSPLARWGTNTNIMNHKSFIQRKTKCHREWLCQLTIYYQ